MIKKKAASRIRLLVRAVFTLRKCRVYASEMACLQSSSDDIGLQTCFIKDAKMLKWEHFYPSFA